MDRKTLRPGVQLSIRAAAAASISVVLAELFHLEHPVFAFAAAVIASDLNPAQSRELGFRRLVATAVGAVCGAALSPILPSRPLAMGLGILVAMLICHLLRASEGARVAGYICGLIVLDQSLEPWRYAFFRFVETGLGVSVAWLVSLVPKLVHIEEARDKEAS